MLLVSAIFDLSQRTDFPKSARKLHEYLQLFKYWSVFEQPMVLYLDATIQTTYATWIASLPACIEVKFLTFEELPAYKLLLPDAPCIENAAARDVFSYAVLTNSKFFLVEAALEAHPSCTGAAWVDAGLCHVSYTPYNRLRKAFQKIEATARPHAVMLNLLTKEHHDEELFKRNNYFIAGGFWFIPCAYAMKFAGACREALTKLRELGRIALEEQILSYVISADYTEWNFSYSTFNSILANLGRLNDPSTALNLLEATYHQSKTNYAGELIKQLLDYLARGGYLQPREMARFLYYGFICSYHQDEQLRIFLASLTRCLCTLWEPLTAAMDNYSNWKKNLAFETREVKVPNEYLSCVSVVVAKQ